MDLTVIGTNLVLYIFGSPLFAGIALLGMIVLVGIRFNFTLETYVITIVPTVSLLTGMYGASEGWIDPWIGIVLSLGIGLVLGMGILGMLRR